MATTYQQKLLDPRWQKKRLEVMHFYKFECQSCGSKTDTLHVHHRQYLKGKEPWEYHLGQLECLCDKCHKDAHTILEELKESLSWCSDTGVVIGFIQGLEYFHCPEPASGKWRVRSHEEAVGFGKAVGIPAKVIIGATKDGLLDGSLVFK